MQNTSNNNTPFMILGIPLHAPSKNDYLTALGVACIVGLPCAALVYFDAITLRNAVLTVTGAIVGIMMNSVGIDPKTHGGRAWGALIIIAAMTFMTTQLAMQYIPALRTNVEEPAKKSVEKTSDKPKTDVKDTKADTTAPATTVKDSTITENNIKVLPEIVVRPSDSPDESADPRTKSLNKERNLQD